jgi:hypothetical protein
MASGAHVTVRGRFSAGTRVELVRVAGAHVLRSEGGEVVDDAVVERDDAGVASVRFSKGVVEGGRYFVRGVDGGPQEVRARGRASDDPGELAQPPVMPDRTRLSDGSWNDKPPTKESAPHVLAGFADLRHAPDGTVLRSDTPRGAAHPLDPDEPAPYRAQADVPDGVVQASDTERGAAAEIPLGPQRQEDVRAGVVQRSATPTGVATPIPAGDSIEQALVRESSRAKEARGDWTRAGAEPLDVKGVRHRTPRGSSQRESEERHAELSRPATVIAAEAAEAAEKAARRQDSSPRSSESSGAAGSASSKSSKE